MQFNMHRIECRHFDLCSGCSLSQNLNHPPVWQDMQVYFSEKNEVKPHLFIEEVTGWRCRAKLAVRGTADRSLIGLFKEGTHDVVSIPFCQVHHPRINEAVEKAEHFIRTHRLAPYQEQQGRGELRYIQCVVERKTGKVQMSFVLNLPSLADPRAQKWGQLLQQWGQEDKEGFWHSLWVNFNAQATNTIFGSQWHLCFGEEFLWETFGQTPVCYHPASFAQANLNLFEKMLGHLENLVPKEAKIAEFYAGVGVIGLYLASKSTWIRCGEVNPHAQEGFLHSLAKQAPENASKISFYTGHVKSLLNLLQNATVAIVDPPRKGLDFPLLEALNGNFKGDLIYVSCGWPSFKRDLETLQTGGWKLQSVNGYLFFDRLLLCRAMDCS
jgi:23S rRNA (uracil1939-C5)-methyltransferase